MTPTYYRNLATTILAALLLSTTACVQHTWAPGPGTDPATFGRASGSCKLAAMGAATPPSIVAASGSPAFVGAAVGAGLIASAVGSAVRQHVAFEACLEASGFVALAPQ